MHANKIKCSISHCEVGEPIGEVIIITYITLILTVSYSCLFCLN